jgi:glutamyl-tRNA reductase
LRRILEKEIRRYWNPDHDAVVEQAVDDFADQVAAVEAEVKAAFKEQLAALRKQEVALSKRTVKAAAAAREVLEQMQQQLKERMPLFEPPVIEFEADEDPAPLFDSRRDYLEQLAAYKKFQSKAPPE